MMTVHDDITFYHLHLPSTPTSKISMSGIAILSMLTMAIPDNGLQ